MAEFHKHHIIPKHMGGSDDPENLICLTVMDHALAHFSLWEKFGKKEDLCAYHMLSGNIEEFRHIYATLGGIACQEQRKQAGLNVLGISQDEYDANKKKWSSMGGIIGGKTNAVSGHMRDISLALTHEERSENGRKSVEKCRELQVNAFFDPGLRTEIAKLGGKIQGKINAESGHMKKISKEYWDKVKSGEIKRVKKFWYYSDIDNVSIQIKEGDPIPVGYVKGRKMKFKNSEV